MSAAIPGSKFSFLPYLQVGGFDPQSFSNALGPESEAIACGRGRQPPPTAVEQMVNAPDIVLYEDPPAGFQGGLRNQGFP